MQPNKGEFAQQGPHGRVCPEPNWSGSVSSFLCGDIWILASKSKFLNAVDWLTSLRRDAAYYKLETVEYSNSDVMQSLDLEDGWGRCFCFFGQ